jgi:predicted nucleic acid-binding protein
VPSFGVVIDADVLIKAGPRDTLLRAAEQGLYRPYWSEMILDEVHRNLTDLLAKRKRPHPAQAAQSLIDEIRRQFPEALVREYEALIPAMKNQEKDRHVLAAAVVAQAEVIVTGNLRDLPAGVLNPYKLEARPPDTFLTDLFELYPDRMVDILTQQGADLRGSRTLERMLDSLAPHVGRFVAAVRSRQA